MPPGAQGPSAGAVSRNRFQPTIPSAATNTAKAVRIQTVLPRRVLFALPGVLTDAVGSSAVALTSAKTVVVASSVEDVAGVRDRSRLDGSCYAKVCDFHMSRGGDEDVARFDISVDNAAFMRSLQCLSDL